MARTMIDIDEQALDAAAQRLGTRTKRDTVNAALRHAARSPSQETATRAILALATDLGEPEVMQHAWRTEPAGATQKTA